MAEDVTGVVIDGVRYPLVVLGGTTTAGGSPAGLMVQGFSSKASKTRVANLVDTTKREVKWSSGDNIMQVMIGAFWSAGATVAVPSAQYAMVCFDCSAAAAVGLIGADGTTVIPQSLDSNQDAYIVPVGSYLLVTFSSALTYDGNVGYVGNAWVRTIDATPDFLDIILMGAS